MNTSSWADEELKGLARDPDYELEKLLLDVNEAIVERMHTLALRKVDLAKMLGVSRAWVTKLLNGNENVTLATLVRVANVLGVQVAIDLVSYEVLNGSVEEPSQDEFDYEVSEGVQIPLAA